ncbi:glycosyltransferase [Barrientosiimonas humi]|uniref:glycosyltransferase n=1 Tax=Barrientosiimonas humi TaxID=999931 RepID=UPI00370D23F9
MVTNGGYGGVLKALQHGIPLVVAGAQQDKAEIAARVRWSGTGVTTATLTPNRRWIDNAVGNALYDSGIRATAARVGDELRAAPGAAGAVRVVEMIAAAQYLP